MLNFREAAGPQYAACMTLGGLQCGISDLVADSYGEKMDVPLQGVQLTYVAQAADAYVEKVIAHELLGADRSGSVPLISAPDTILTRCDVNKVVEKIQGFIDSDDFLPVFGDYVIAEAQADAKVAALFDNGTPGQP